MSQLIEYTFDIHQFLGSVSNTVKPGLRGQKQEDQEFKIIFD